MNNIILYDLLPQGIKIIWNDYIKRKQLNYFDKQYEKVIYIDRYQLRDLVRQEFEYIIKTRKEINNVFDNYILNLLNKKIPEYDKKIINGMKNIIKLINNELNKDFDKINNKIKLLK